MLTIAVPISSGVGPSLAILAISPIIALVVATASALRVALDATNEPRSPLRSKPEPAV